MNPPNFDTATAGGVPIPAAPKVCQRCNMMLDEQFLLVHGKPACEYCAPKLRNEPKPAASEGGSEEVKPVRETTYAGGTPLALAYGFAASLAAATAYAAIVLGTGYEFGFMAIGVGWLIGTAVHKGNGRGAGTGLRVAAIAFVYLAMVLAYSAIGVYSVYNSGDETSTAYRQMLDESLSALKQAGAGTTAGVMLISVLSMAVVFPVVGGLFGLLFLAIGMHQAWSTSGAKGELEEEDAGPVRVRVGDSE